ncbi:MAG TPA: ABC transporter ATP-binding protein [Planctomycetota bacterium]
MAEIAIQVENLAKTFGRGGRAVTALDGVTLNVAQGEIYGLLGRNGAGKTTLVKILLDIVRPTAGQARLRGIDARRPSARARIGYLPEDHRFPDYRTGEGVLHYYAGLSAMSSAQRKTRVPELLKLTGLSDAAHRKVRTYSKGMKQRLGLAQALVHDPQVVLLDEPTDGVDPVGRAQIRDVLRQLKERGTTIFLNSHLLSEVERICDRAAIIEKGRLVREGTLAALTSGGSVYTLNTSAPLDEQTRAALLEIAHSVTDSDGGYQLDLRCDEDVDRVVDLLRARKIGIRGLTSKRLSLEEVFLQVVDTRAGESG